MPMFFGSRDGLKPSGDFTEEEALRLIAGIPCQEIGEPTEFIDEVLRKVDELLLQDSDEPKYPIVFQWDFETTGHLWKFDLYPRAYTMGDCSKMACEIIMRSKGSLWCMGRDDNTAAWQT